jgi:hypothetical protein
MEKERLLQVTNIPHMPGNDPAAAPNNKLQPQYSKSTIGASHLGQTILFPKQTPVYSFFQLQNPPNWPGFNVRNQKCMITLAKR